ncbi:hypothetical protein PG993_006897 [Apiospora rasikravindrae]|uniref:Uncharacterized protein n=1 Tax=Apiospora rasikravindrae TaxID=990691 RepID=A0ABR1SVY7_9PEZI
MAPRISLPKISLFGLSQITTPEPISPQSIRKLRNTLPSSPLAASPLYPPPPREPFPFLWQCCSCYTTYRFSTTRRCLLCSHNYCTRDVAFGNNSSSSTTNGKKRRHRNRYCRSEFDYEGWEAWGAWRRGHVLRIESTREQDADAELQKREQKFLQKTQDCSVHCDFPSQCFHTKIRVLEDERRELAAQREAHEDAEREGGLMENDEILMAYAASTRFSLEEDDEVDYDREDDRLELNLARDLPEDENDETSPTSPIIKAPFFYDQNNQSQINVSNSTSSSSSSNRVPVIIPGLTYSPAVDATKLTHDELFALIDEDDEMMAYEDSRAGKREGADSRLSVRNPTELVDWTDLDENSESSESEGEEHYFECHESRPTSSGSDSSNSSAADWENADEDVEMADTAVAEEEAALRDFRRVRHTFMIEA